MSDLRQNLTIEAKRAEEDSLYSAKRHFVASSFWTNFHYWVGVPTAILSAVAGASALSRFDNHNAVAGVLAILVAALTAVTTFLNPREKAKTHLDAGNKYNALRNSCRIFYEIDGHSNRSDHELTKELKDLVKRRDELNEKSPLTPWWAFRIARRGIEAGEAKYVVDGDKG